MMKIGAKLILWASLILSVTGLITTTTAQQVVPSILPHDLIFAIEESANSFFRYNRLVRVEAETLAITTFYVDDNVDVLDPVAWSPDGSYLAILRTEYIDNKGLDWEYTRTICVLTRHGDLQACMDDPTVQSRGLAPYISDTVTWSNDNRYIYYLNEMYDTETTGQIRLIEADTVTGATTRIVYAYPFRYNVIPEIMWTSDFSYVAINVGQSEMFLDEPTQLVDLVTSEYTNFSDFLPDIAKWHFVCPTFSPLGTTIDVTTGMEDGNYNRYAQLTLYEKTGEYTTVFDHKSGFGRVEWIDCPHWQANEKAFFFTAQLAQSNMLPVGTRIPRLFKHSMETGETSLYFDFEVLNWVGSRSLILSPDEEHFALLLERYVQPEDAEPTSGLKRIYRIVVVYPDGTFLEIDGPYESARFLIWVPPMGLEQMN